jgi:hypothetical protein
MKSAPNPHFSGSIDGPLPGFTKDAIASIRDFTARKTLEQSHAFAQGLAEVLRPGNDNAQSEVADALAGIGIYRSDAEHLALESLALMQLIAERDRRAELLEAAAAAAAERERSLYARLSSFARLLRLKLGPTSPALALFGVPSEPGPPPTLRARTLRPAALEPSPPSK